MRKPFAIASALVVTAGSQAAWAGTSDGTMLVSATALENCTITATPMAFGSVTLGGSAIDSTSTLTLACTPNADFDVLINDGSNASAGQRRMANLVTGGYIPYDIYLDSNHTQHWGNTVGTNTKSGNANALGVASYTAYGRIASSTTAVQAGLYTDTVTVTVSF